MKKLIAGIKEFFEDLKSIFGPKLIPVRVKANDRRIRHPRNH